MTHTGDFDAGYKQLNTKQKEAVDTIDGPVMVVAGPGTGKTQVLSLRIANILTQTDTPPDGVLCLTFTNSGVRAMKERLRGYIGAASSQVQIYTFHSFGMKVIEEFFPALDLDVAPKLMDDMDSIALVDTLLHEHEWQHLRPRADATRYYYDLKSVISLLKRERISPDDFLVEVERDIESAKSDPENISSRGATKGQLKQETVKKIEGLERTREVVRFYELYEEAKKEKNVFNYDDVLENLVKIVENSDEARDTIRERYLYILVDEHQDSSGVQNEFLTKVWGDVEKPNIFVVGDDRQLIYGFGGASLEYFEGFKHSFGKAKLINLVDNYRSTQVILDSAESLLQSEMSKEKLVSHSKESLPLRLVECDYPRDEILAAADDIAEKIKQGMDPNHGAILVPKNKQVRSAIAILRDRGIPVASSGTVDLFDSRDAIAFMRVLAIVADPYNGTALAESFFEPLSGIAPLAAHTFLHNEKTRDFSLVGLTESKKPALFTDAVGAWIEKLRGWIDASNELNVYSLIQKVGEELLLDTAKDHDELVSRVEVIRTILHLVLSQVEKNPKLKLADFLVFIDRLESYGEHLPLAVFSADEGVKVLTLHGSKGLEFDAVWIAHMDERSLVSGKRGGFTLPQRIAVRVEQKDEMVTKRQLYVAITRAKRYCTLSYAKHSYTGGEQELARVLADLPEEAFEKVSLTETEEKLLDKDPKAYVTSDAVEISAVNRTELSKLVAKNFVDHNVTVTLLNNFFECPWKWYFRNILQLPEMKSESLEFGNVVHASIDRILKLERKPTEKEIKDIVHAEVLKREYGLSAMPAHAGEARMEKEAYGIVSRWAEHRLPDISKKRENEKSISVKDERFPELTMYGKIDLIEKLDEKNVRVTDFKTGSPKKKTDVEKRDSEERMSGYLRQLAMYSYLLEESPQWDVAVRESRLEFVEAKSDKDVFYEKSIGSEEMDSLINDITDYAELVKKGKWLDRPCNYNSYGKNTECEYCARAKLYNA